MATALRSLMALITRYCLPADAAAATSAVAAHGSTGNVRKPSRGTTVSPEQLVNYLAKEVFPADWKCVPPSYVRTVFPHESFPAEADDDPNHAEEVSQDGRRGRSDSVEPDMEVRMCPNRRTCVLKHKNWCTQVPSKVQFLRCRGAAPVRHQFSVRNLLVHVATSKSPTNSDTSHV